MRNIATGFATYGCVSSWSSQLQGDLIDMQPFYGVVNFGITLVQVTRDLRTLDYESDGR